MKISFPNVSEKVPWIIPDSKVHVTNVGPNWVMSAPGGSHVGHMDLSGIIDLDPTLHTETVPPVPFWKQFL